MISRFKDSKLIKAHINPRVDRGSNKDAVTLYPSDGVVYQPNIDEDYKIEGEPYKKEQRDFQKKVIQNLGKRQHTLPKTERMENDIRDNSRSPEFSKDYLDDSIEFSKFKSLSNA